MLPKTPKPLYTASMINQASIAAVRAARFGPGFTRPLYETYNFLNLPGTIYRVLTGTAHPDLPCLPADCLPGGLGQIRQVIFILVDGFGWDKLTADLPAYQLFAERGVVSCLTCQYPSTTVVHSTTMASGLGSGQAGVLEWFYHEPKIGSVIAPFLLNKAGERQYGTLKASGYGAADIFPTGQFNQTLQAAGVRCYSYSSAAFTPSDFSDRTQEGCNLVPGYGPASSIAQLQQHLGQDGKAWHFVYLDSYDTIEHKLGASSAVARAEAENIFLLLERLIGGKQSNLPSDTLLLVSADHGQVDQRPEEAIYVNQLWPELESLLEVGRDGRPLAGAGASGRSLMLHLKPGASATVRHRLQTLLDGRATIYSHEDMLELGLFGPGPHVPDLRERAGDLVILSHADSAVWWYEKGRFDVHNKGNHGSLSHQEMEIPLLALATNRL